MIEIEIDGQKLQVEPGSMVIEVADKVGIPIPRFCYHKKLSIAANCRMCLVEVEKSPKPLPACATPVTPGMKVFTTSGKTKEAQRSVMEFLLINHPLDCPICDQGGECELQDVSLVYGGGASRFHERKRSVKDDNLGPLISTEMTRCIQCSRCVRFGTEIAGLRELGMVGRGESEQITTYVKHSMQSELSGNIIDLCPVGALTSKPFRFTARAWELQQVSSVAPHDCVGSNIFIHSLRQNVMRVVPRENETINEMWLSDRDRFSYLGLEHGDRLERPLVKVEGEWQETDWPTAFAEVVRGFNSIKEQYGPQEIAALASPSSTLEELYLLQKLLRGFGSNNIDHRLQQTDFSDQEFMPLFPKLGLAIDEIEQQDVIVLIGSNVQREQPIIGHRIRKATLRGAQVLSINLSDYAVNFTQQETIVVPPQELTTTLAGIIKALAELKSSSLPPAISHLITKVKPNAAQQNLAKSLQQDKKIAVLVGALAQNHPQAATITAFSKLLAELASASFSYLTTGGNSAGAWLAGAIPHRLPGGIAVADRGLAAHEALLKQLKAYLLLNIEPELDCTDSAQAHAALKHAEFVVALSPFKSDRLQRIANVILPMAAFSETEGTFINGEGRWQNLMTSVNPFGEARPAWKILRVLANELAIPGFNYFSVQQIKSELQQILDEAPSLATKNFYPHEMPSAEQHSVTRITEWPIYAIDNLVRRSEALQQAASNDPVAVYMNADLAKHLKVSAGSQVKVKQGTAHVKLPVIISARIPNNCVLVHAGREQTAALGPAFGAIEIYA